MKKLLALAAAAVLTILPAQAAPYTLFIYESGAQLALRPSADAAGAAYWAAYDAYGKQLEAAGILRGGSALTTGAPVAQVVAGETSRPETTFAVTPLALGGYFQIEVASDEEAIAWAARLPVADGVVEVRAGYLVPGMAM